MARTILLADDSPTIRKIVELTFSDSDLRVESAESGEEALEKIERLDPDLVLADVVMPGPSGYEICRTVKGSERPIPVILLAGTFEPFDRQQAADCGADAHIVKPFESGALREKVEQLLGRTVAAEATPAEDEPPVPAELEHVMDELSEDAGEEPPAEPAEQAAPETEEPAPRPVAPGAEIDPALVDAVAREVVKRLSEIVIREIAWEVVPEVASKLVRERIREIEAEQKKKAGGD